MSAIEEILGKLPVDQLAAELGTDQDSVTQAASAAIESLLAGMQNNAADPLGEQALAAALAKHADKAQGLEQGSVDLTRVDVADGEKIVGHVLGADSQTAATQLLGGSGASLLGKLLPILAPIVLSYVSGKATKASTGSGGSLIETMLGSLLGGGSRTEDYQRGYQDGFAAAQQRAQGSGGLGDLLGGMLVGSQQQAGGLGGLLGGLFR